jgi:hypothetical protein
METKSSNNKKFMKKSVFVLNFFLLIFIFQSCMNDRNKKRFKWTDVICNQLYVESYVIISKGTEGAERLSQYLTDSVNFRIHIGNIVQGRDYNSYECSGDSIIIRRKIYGEVENSKIYSIKSLKSERKFE